MFRSTVAWEGDRHGFERVLAECSCFNPGLSPGRPPCRTRCTRRCSTPCCDPWPPRRATATRLCPQPAAGRVGCDARSPPGQPPQGDGLHGAGGVPVAIHARPEDDRHPPTTGTSTSLAAGATHGSSGGRLPHQSGTKCWPSTTMLRSTASGGRPPLGMSYPFGTLPSGCDPRPLRGMTATSAHGRRLRPLMTLRSTVAPEDDRHSSAPAACGSSSSSCEPRPPRRAAAATRTVAGIVTVGML